MTLNEIKKDTLPFVGLAPYGTENSNHFYGRERAVEDILSILQKNKFVCLTGSSGSGKTSLIFAGLIPRLLNGFNGVAGTQWSVCSFRPSDSPLENFAQALSFDKVLTPKGKSDTNDYLSYLEKIKDLGTDSLRSIYKESEIFGKRNLLIVIDQIEDIFHISKKLNYTTSTDDDLLFDIVNKTVRFKDVSIYFVLITKTSHLTNLSQYSGLQDLISNNQYAIQSISFNGLNKIIHEGFKDIKLLFSADVVDLLYEELKEDNSLLPNFQFLLFKLYHLHSGNIDKRLLQKNDLKNFKNLKTFINNQFTAFYKGLNEDQKSQLQLIFSSFYNPSNFSSKSYINTVGQVKMSAGLSDEDFYRWTRLLNSSFQLLLQVVPSLSTQTKTDLSFNKWSNSDLIHLNYPIYFNPEYFEEWMRNESISHWRFKEYAQILKAYEKKERGLLMSPQLEIAVEWLNDDLVNNNWATKYNLPFNEVQNFISLSENSKQEQIKQAEFKREKESQKERFQKRLYLIFTLISISLMLFAAYKWQDADAARKQESKEKKVAQKLMKENQIISELIKIKSKAPSMLLKLQRVGEKGDKDLILQHVQELIKTEVLFDSLNNVFSTSYVTDDWMHELNVTALSLLEDKLDYTETSMLIGDLKTYPVLDFSIYNNKKVAFVGHRNKLSIVNLDNKRSRTSIFHQGLFKGRAKRILFIEDDELLILTSRNELIQLTISTKTVKTIHKASMDSPIIDFIYNPVDQLIVIVNEKQLIFRQGNGQKKIIDELGDHYTASFYNNELYLATNRGVFLVDIDGTINKFEIIKDSNPSLKGLTAFHVKANYIFIGFEDGVVKMYQRDKNRLNLQHVFSLDEHLGSVTSVYYNSLEEVLYTSGVDDRIFRYNLRIEDDEIEEDFSELKGHKSTVWKIDGFKNIKGQQILITADQEGHLLSWYIDDIDMVKDLKALLYDN